MKKNCTVKALAALWVTGMLISSCQHKKNKPAHHDPAAVKIDSNLSHLLKPVNEQVVSGLPVIKAAYGTKIFMEEVQGVIDYDTRSQNSIASRVNGRIERLTIKYNYQPVRKGQLIMEVYSPELAAAQQELLYLSQSKGDLNLLESAKKRLMLLGLSADAVSRIIKTRKVNYRIPVYSQVDGYILEKSAPAIAVPVPVTAPVAGGGDGMSNMGSASSAPATPSGGTAVANTPLMLREGQYVSAGQSLFTVYNADKLVANFSIRPGLATLLKKGHQFLFYKTGDKSTLQRAEIGLIQPVFKAGENFTVARSYLSKPAFHIGELLTASIPVQIRDSWWLPETALVSLGNQSIVFKKQDNVVVPKRVKTGVSINGMVQVKENIGDWQISTNAAYLVDSESFIKAGLK